MKLNENFVIHTIDGQVVLVPLNGASFRGLVQGNKSVGVILECLSRGADEEEIVSVMCSRFKGDREPIREDVSDVLTKLKAIGAIDE